MEQEVMKMKRREGAEAKVEAHKARLQSAASEKAEVDKEKNEIFQTRTQAREEARRKLATSNLDNRKAMADKLVADEKSHDERRRILLAEKQTEAAKRRAYRLHALEAKKQRDEDEHDVKFETFTEKWVEVDARQAQVATPRIAVHTPRARTATNGSAGGGQSDHAKALDQLNERREANWNRYLENLKDRSANACDRNLTSELRIEQNLLRNKEKLAERLAAEEDAQQQKQLRARTTTPRGRDARRPQDTILEGLVVKNKERVRRRDENRRCQHLAKIFLEDEKYANEQFLKRRAEIEFGERTAQMVVDRDKVNFIMGQISHMSKAQMRSVVLPGGVSIEFEGDDAKQADAGQQEQGLARGATRG
jgi:hypothetical protein